MEPPVVDLDPDADTRAEPCATHRHPATGGAFLLLGILAALAVLSSVQAIASGSQGYAELTWGHAAGIGLAVGGIVVGVGLLRGSRAACLAGRAAAWIAVALGAVLVVRASGGQAQPYGGLVLLGAVVIATVIWVVSGLILLGLRHRRHG